MSDKGTLDISGANIRIGDWEGVPHSIIDQYKEYNSHSRAFYLADGWADKDINLPVRATKNAAGYDFEAAEDIEIPSMLEDFTDRLLKRSPDRLEHIGRDSHLMPEYFYINPEEGNAVKPVLIPTGIKADMYPDEFLALYNRSSNPKRGLYLANGVGVVDGDYFGNEGNDGHIYFAFLNLSPHTLTIKKGQRIGQGVFQKFLRVESDKNDGATRTGGYGSTGA